MGREDNNYLRDRATKLSRDLMRRIIAGDATAEAEAWTHYDASLRKVAWRFCDCEDDVNDRISMTWEIALPKLRAGELINRSALGCYLRGIVRAVSLGELRKRSWLNISGDTEHLEQCLIDETTPFHVIAKEQALKITMTVIEDLAVERDREVIALEVIEEADRDDMCAAYDVTHLQMSRWLCRARTRLRKHVDASEAIALATI